MCDVPPGPLSTERVVNLSNCLPSDTVDFSSLTAVAQLSVSISVIFATSQLFCVLVLCVVRLFLVILLRAAVSAVLQLCRTC